MRSHRCHSPSCQKEESFDQLLGETSKLRYCNRCHLVVYCNELCQKSDWSIHKKVCVSREKERGLESLLTPIRQYIISNKEWRRQMIALLLEYQTNSKELAVADEKKEADLQQKDIPQKIPFVISRLTVERLEEACGTITNQSEFKLPFEFINVASTESSIMSKKARAHNVLGVEIQIQVINFENIKSTTESLFITLSGSQQVWTVTNGKKTHDAPIMRQKNIDRVVTALKHNGLNQQEISQHLICPFMDYLQRGRVHYVCLACPNGVAVSVSLGAEDITENNDKCTEEYIKVAQSAANSLVKHIIDHMKSSVLQTSQDRESPVAVVKLGVSELELILHQKEKTKLDLSMTYLKAEELGGQIAAMTKEANEKVGHGVMLVVEVPIPGTRSKSIQMTHYLIEDKK